MTVNVFSKFLGKKVDLGIPNYNRSDRLFWLTGRLIEVDNDFLILKINNGVRKIPIDDVREISLSRREQ